MKVKKEFEQQNGTTESGNPIIKKFVKDQEIRDEEARFMYHKKGDEYLAVVEGVKVDAPKGVKTFSELRSEAKKEVEDELKSDEKRKAIEEAKRKAAIDKNK